MSSPVRVEDFDKDDREIAEKIAGIFNGFSDDVYRQVNGNLTFENLDRQLVTLEVRIDGDGKVLNKPQIKLTLVSRISGVKVINARNLESSTTYPTSCPFVSYEVGEKLITIRNVTGLQNNSRYELTLEIIGS